MRNYSTDSAKTAHADRVANKANKTIVQIDPEFRCWSCNKLLAKSNGHGHVAGLIKCPRCNTINEARLVSIASGTGA